MRAREMAAWKKRIARAWGNEKDPDMYAYLIEQVSLVCSDAEWEEIGRYDDGLRKRDGMNYEADKAAEKPIARGIKMAQQEQSDSAATNWRRCSTCGKLVPTGGIWCRCGIATTGMTALIRSIISDVCELDHTSPPDDTTLLTMQTSELEAILQERMIADEMWLLAERLWTERDSLQADLDKTRAESRALRRERNGEVWYWQGDEYDHLESLTCPVLIEAGDLREIVGERDRLQSRITKLEHQADERNAGYDVLFRSCEQHRDRADRCEGMLVADRRAIGNLLARIFGDGGHRQQAIGDLTAACEEADSVVLTERQALVNLWPALSDLMQDLRRKGNDTTPCDAYHEGYKLACRGIATQIRQLLAASSAAGAEGAGGAEEEGKP